VGEATLTPAERFVIVSFYLALMTATGLEIVGVQGPVLVEGPFAENGAYLDMLAAATGRPVEAVAGTGTSLGAALLYAGTRPAIASGANPRPLQEAALRRYASAWQARL
jgi:sugar (pentulose or hexulose) kinase